MTARVSRRWTWTIAGLVFAAVGAWFVVRSRSTPPGEATDGPTPRSAPSQRPLTEARRDAVPWVGALLPAMELARERDRLLLVYVARPPDT